MIKKIYDIVPPEEEKEPSLIKESSGNKILENKQHQPKKKNQNHHRRLWVISFGVLILFLGIFVLWSRSYASKAQIDIWPKTEDFSYNLTLTASTSTRNIDFHQSLVPAHQIELTKEFSKSFPASIVDVSSKATGIIRVYNKYKNTVILVKGTRFLSSTNPTRLFRSQRKIIIPAGRYVDVKVVASEPGRDYNIPASAFSIPGLRNFSPPQLYYDVFGKSFSKMEGGKIAKVNKIADSDVAKAKQEIEKIAQQGIMKALKDRALQEKDLVLEKTINSKIISQGILGNKVGDEKKSFVYQAKMQIQALAVSKDDLRKFVEQYTPSKLPKGKQVDKNSISIKTISAVVNQGGSVILNLSVSQKVYPVVDIDALKKLAVGQSPHKISNYFLDVYPNVLKVPQIKLKPFFARRMPKNKNNIVIEIILNH